MAVAALEALEILQEEPERRQRLAHLISAAGRAALASGAAAPTGSQILPLIFGDDRAAVALAAGLQRRGFDVRAVRPPTVPDGTARLRISITLNVEELAVGALFAALAEERGVRAA
jgi:8-amino-7-oxononanoate synthase